MSRRGRVWQDGRAKDAPAVRGVPWHFVVDIAPPGAKRKQVWRGGFATQKAAQAALDELLASVRTGAFVEPSKSTLGVYLTGWLDGLAVRGLRPSTIDGYRRKLEYVMRDDLADVPLQAVTPAALDRFYSTLIAHGGRGGTGLGLQTVRHVHVVLGKALADAERQDVIARNPARRATPPTATAVRSPEAQTWTPEQLAAFLERTADHDHAALFRLAGMTGLRRGELCGLRWDDLDLDTGRLMVRRTLGFLHGEVVVGDAKTQRSRRTVEVDAETVAVMRRHRTAQLEQRMLMGGGYCDGGYVFAQPTGAPWNPDAVGRSFARAVESSGLPRIRFHDLRHSHATHLLAAGVNPRVVSERLGHATVGFTLDVYGHVMDGQQADAAAAVAALVDATRH